MMHDGRKIVEGTPDEIRANQLVHELYLGGRVTDDGHRGDGMSAATPAPATAQVTAPLLEVKDLNVYYGRAHVLQDVTFEMGDEPVSLIGRNGMGKTTLCNAIMQMPPAARDGLDPLRRARSSSGGRPTRSPAPASATCPRAGGCSSRSPSTSTCAWPRRAAASTAGRRTRSTSCSRAWPSASGNGGMQLSGGEQQMLAIGRALLSNPKLLIMDEPSEGLAPTIIETLIETFRGLAAEGLAILVVEQNLAMATAMAERQLVMVAGRISAETTAAELANDPEAQRRWLGVERGMMARRSSLVGTLDTKGHEYAYLRDRMREAGVDVAARRRGRARRAAGRARRHAARRSRARRAPTTPSSRAAGDRGAAMDVMGRGAGGRARAAARRGPTSTASPRSAARATRRSPPRRCATLPVGVPKLIVSTVASGDTRPYVGAIDVTMTYSVVDIAGHQPDLRADPRQRGRRDRRAWRRRAGRPRRRATARSSARRCSASPPRASRRARERLEELGYEVLVFHATGTGGQSMEALADRRLPRRRRSTPTTTELADELVGGVLSAGPDRLEAVGPRRHPAGRLARRARHGQLRPARHRARAVRRPQPLRAQPDDHAHAHDARGDAPSSAGGSPSVSTAPTGPTVLFVPLRGVSAIDVDGQPFRDAEADAALFAALREHVDTVASRCTSSTPTSTTRRSPPRWPTACTSSSEAGDDARARRWRGCASRSRRGGPIIGAGAGTGLSAKCAEAGGADLIIIYNSGRYRMAGRGSLAGMMPYGDANAIVMDMAREVLPVVQRHAGARRRLRHRPVPADGPLPRPRSKTPGFAGVQNFPTVGLIDGTFRAGLEETGHGLRPRGRDDPPARASWTCSPRPTCSRRDEARGDGRGRLPTCSSRTWA